MVSIHPQTRRDDKTVPPCLGNQFSSQTGRQVDKVKVCTRVEGVGVPRPPTSPMVHRHGRRDLGPSPGTVAVHNGHPQVIPSCGSVHRGRGDRRLKVPGPLLGTPFFRLSCPSGRSSTGCASSSFVEPSRTTFWPGPEGRGPPRGGVG